MEENEKAIEIKVNWSLFWRDYFRWAIPFLCGWWGSALFTYLTS
tara:strand:+ start:29374 stop:29505 length:132 start_codon:yes stop_codon:yes gene_type:complete